jgi:hypothetical protein
VERQRRHRRYSWPHAELPYNPLLVTCFDGLIEEKHPYGFIAYNVTKDMIDDEVPLSPPSPRRRS